MVKGLERGGVNRPVKIYFKQMLEARAALPASIGRHCRPTKKKQNAVSFGRDKLGTKMSPSLQNQHQNQLEDWLPQK